MPEINPRGELILRLSFEGRNVVVRHQVDTDHRRRGLRGLIELLPALYKALIESMERMQDREADLATENKKAG